MNTKKSKPGREIRVETQIKQTTEPDKDDKKRKNAETWDKKKKKPHKKNYLKKLAKEGRLKSYRQRVKAIQTKHDISKQRKKIHNMHTPMMWKILTAQIREDIYFSLTSRGLFPEEQKGCCKRSRGTVELLYIDQHILNESKTRQKNLARAGVDYKKAYDMVLQSWIINSKCTKYHMKS